MRFTTSHVTGLRLKSSETGKNGEMGGPSQIEVMNGPLKFLTGRKILPLLDLIAKFKRVLTCFSTCLCSPNFCVARKLAKQIFYFCSCSQKNRSARHARECSQRPFVTPTDDVIVSCQFSSRFGGVFFRLLKKGIKFIGNCFVILCVNLFFPLPRWYCFVYDFPKRFWVAFIFELLRFWQKIQSL